MNKDDLAKPLSRRLTRLTRTVKLWGAAITILLALILVLLGTPICGHDP